MFLSFVIADRMKSGDWPHISAVGAMRPVPRSSTVSAYRREGQSRIAHDCFHREENALGALLT
jgi:hypothetical protein